MREGAEIVCALLVKGVQLLRIAWRNGASRVGCERAPQRRRGACAEGDARGGPGWSIVGRAASAVAEIARCTLTRGALLLTGHETWARWAAADRRRRRPRALAHPLPRLGEKLRLSPWPWTTQLDPFLSFRRIGNPVKFGVVFEWKWTQTFVSFSKI
jgi:hypothetical protein